MFRSVYCFQKYTEWGVTQYCKCSTDITDLFCFRKIVKILTKYSCINLKFCLFFFSSAGKWDKCSTFAAFLKLHSRWSLFLPLVFYQKNVKESVWNSSHPSVVFLISFLKPFSILCFGFCIQINSKMNMVTFRWMWWVFAEIGLLFILYCAVFFSYSKLTLWNCFHIVGVSS